MPPLIQEYKICKVKSLNCRPVATGWLLKGNKTAQKEVAQIDQAETAAKREMGLLQTALSKLTELAEEEQQQILDKVEEQKQLKAADLAESICDTNAAIDAKLVEVRDLLQLRADNLNALRALAVTDSMYLSRMGKDLVTAAFASHGLAKYVDIHAGAPNSIRPLGASNTFFRDIGKKLQKVDAA